MRLHEWRLKNLNQPVSSFFFDEAARRNWVLDAPYQRQPVWSLRDRQDLVESILQALPIGAIYVNARSWDDAHVQVVDGQQRIRTLQAFVDDEFGVPLEWFDDEDLARPRETYEDGLVRFSGMTRRRQFKFEMFPVAVYWTDLPDVESEAALYLRKNRAGVAQTEADLNRAATVAEGGQL